MGIQVNDINLDRQDLASFLPDLRSIKAFESLVKAVTQQIPDAINASPQDVGTLLSFQSFTKAVPRPPDVRGDGYISVTIDAQGTQLSLSPESLVIALLPYLPRPVPSGALPSADASQVLVNQIFGA